MDKAFELAELVKVGKNDKATLGNLLEKYDYDFSQYEDSDVDDTGLYGYKYLDEYFTQEDNGRHAFFIKVDGKLAGFVLVRSEGDFTDNADYSIAEFFVMHKYRRMGLGEYAFARVLDMFKGKWEVSVLQRNLPALSFWTKTISKCTSGEYVFEVKRLYRDVSGYVFSFKTGDVNVE